MRHVSQIFNLENFATSPGTSLKFLTLKTFAMSSGTFLKFSTLKNLPCYAERLSFFFNSKVLSCPPTISSLYIFIDMFATLSTSFGRWCVCVCVCGGGGGDVVLC